MSAILYLKLSSDTLSLSNESNSAVVDLDVRCSTDQTKVMKVCLCEDPGLADRYCRNVTDVEFKRKFRWQGINVLYRPYSNEKFELRGKVWILHKFLIGKFQDMNPSAL